MQTTRQNIVLAFLMAIILATPTANAPPATTSSTSSTTTTIVKVEPALVEYYSNATGQEFTVATKIINVTNLYGFDIKFRWNTTFLDYVTHSIHIPKNTYTDGVLWNPVLQLANTVNSTAGTYWIAYSSLAPASSFNGSGTAFTMTFKVKYHPVEPEPTANIKLELYSTELPDRDAKPIPHTREDGTVILHAIRPKVAVEPKFIEFGNSSGASVPIPGTQFTVAVNIYNLTNLYGFDLKFRWNATFLKYVTHSVHVPKDTYSDGILWGPTLQLADEVNVTAGTYWIAYSSLAPAPSFNGSGTVFTMILEVAKQPYDFETGTQAIDSIDFLLDFISIDLSDRNAKAMAPDVEPATVRIWERSFPLPPSPVLKVMPSIVGKLPTNSSFNIDVWILGLNSSYDIASFNITLNFNSTLIEAVSITKGSWAENYAENSTELIKQINNIAGTATYSLALDPRKPEPPTTGILFTVTFRVVHESLMYPPPSCELALAPTNITDRTFGSITHTIENSTYTANRPSPVAKFAWSPNSYALFLGQNVTFDASESYHPLGGKIELYQWDFGDGTKEKTTKPMISHTYLASGTITVILNVTDYGGFWDIKSITLYIVEPPPKPHIALEPVYKKFGPYPPEVVGQQFNISVYISNLDAAWSLEEAQLSLSYNATLIDVIGDAANVTISRLWTGPNNCTVLRFQGGTSRVTITVLNPSAPPSGNVPIATIRFAIKHQGLYPTIDTSYVTLSAVKLIGFTGEILTEPPINGQVVIRGLSQPLKAYFTYSPLNPKINEPVTFNASDSAPMIYIDNYTWNFGDGNITSINSPLIIHKFSTSGTYKVTLNVTDVDGLSNTVLSAIIIETPTTDSTLYIIAGVIATAMIGAAVLFFMRIKKSNGSKRFSTHTAKVEGGSRKRRQTRF